MYVDLFSYSVSYKTDVLWNHYSDGEIKFFKIFEKWTLFGFYIIKIFLTFYFFFDL